MRFNDNESFRRRVMETVFSLTYDRKPIEQDHPQICVSIRLGRSNDG